MQCSRICAMSIIFNWKFPDSKWHATYICYFLLVLNIYPFHHCDLERGKQGSDSERIASNDQHIYIKYVYNFKQKKVNKAMAKIVHETVTNHFWIWLQKIELWARTI